MVKASETFGPPPVCSAWLITASVSAFHHSPNEHTTQSISLIVHGYTFDCHFTPSVRNYAFSF
jgi:hypothetical protein